MDFSSLPPPPSSPEPTKSPLPDEITYYIVFQYETSTGETWDEENRDNSIVFKRVSLPASSRKKGANEVKEPAPVPVVKQNPSVKLVMPGGSKKSGKEKMKMGGEKGVEGAGGVKQGERGLESGKSSSGESSSDDAMAVKKGVKSQEEATTTTKEKPPLYAVTLNWRSYTAEHICIPLPHDHVGFRGFTDFEFVSMNEAMELEYVEEDSIEYEFVDEYDDDGFPFLKLHMSFGHDRSGDLWCGAWCKMADEGFAYLTREERERLRGRGDWEMGLKESEVGEEESCGGEESGKGEKGEEVLEEEMAGDIVDFQHEIAKVDAEVEAFIKALEKKS